MILNPFLLKSNSNFTSFRVGVRGWGLEVRGWGLEVRGWGLEVRVGVRVRVTTQ
jgi:hypothetical protein